MNSFSSQLLALLGVPPLPPTVRSVQSDSTLTDWQLDALLRRRIFENVDKSMETLGSIVQLVDQIENMPVGAGVRGDVQDALSALDKVSSYSLFILVAHISTRSRCSPHLATRSPRLLCTLPKHSRSPPAHSSTQACWRCYTSPRSINMQCTHRCLQVLLCHFWRP
jgi:hypothetical protein